MIDSRLKSKVLKQLLKGISDKIRISKGELKKLNEDMSGETKSSMGDKYETGRAMIQMELEKKFNQFINLQEQVEVLNNISVGQGSDVVKTGSIIETNQGLYFISIPSGVVEVEGEKIFCISRNSPIAQPMIGKKVGDSYEFNGKEFFIISLL